MKTNNFFSKAAKGVLFVLCIAMMASQAYAVPTINSVYPTMGIKGKDLPVTIKGSGFDENTRVSMSLDFKNRKAILGSLKIDGANSIKISGTLAYVTSYAGLQVLDISNPLKPIIIGSLNIPNGASGVIVSGSTVYIREGSSALKVIDVSNPSVPKIIGTVNISGVPAEDTYSFGASASTVYVGNCCNYIDSQLYYSLKSIDVSNLSTSDMIEIWDTQVEVDHFVLTGYIAISGTIAYLGTGTRLTIIDVSNPLKPEIISLVDIDNGSIARVVVSESKPYVAADSHYGTGMDTLHVIDVSNPANPKIIGTVKTIYSGVYNFTISASTVYIPTDDGLLTMIDVSDPSNPKIIGDVDTGGHTDVAVSGSIAYVASPDGLTIIDVGNSLVTEYIGSMLTAGFITDVAVSGSTGYAVMDNWGRSGSEGSELQIIDMSNPKNPNIIGHVYPEKNQYFDIVSASDSIVLVIGHDISSLYDRLTLIDVSNPSNPIGYVNTFNTPYHASATSIELDGFTAYITYSGQVGVRTILQIIDVSNPSNPKIIGTVDTPDSQISAYGVAVSDSKAYVTTAYFGGYGLKVIDVNNPANPKIIGYMNMNSFTEDIAVSGSIAYIVSGLYLYVVDVSNPENPNIISSVKIPGYSARKVLLSGSTVYVMRKLPYIGNGLSMIDVSDPLKPALIGTIDASSVAVIGNNTLITKGSSNNSLIVVPLPVAVKPKIINDTTLSVTLPSPPIPGNYTIQVLSNNSEVSELPGAVTFVPPEDSYLLDTKAIIVVGDKSDNNIRSETFLAADYSYKTLLYQGYTAESINYLSSDTSQPGIDGKASLSAISEAVNTWSIRAPKATELLIYLVGHGQKGYFMINDNEQLSAEHLDEWLDNLQNTYNIPVTVIYDACYSGTFLPKLTPPLSKKRIVISGASTEEAYFINGGRLSASYQFWDAVYQGNEIGKAFRTARNQMKSWQTALMDADGDGISTEADIALAESMRVRRNYKSQNDVPYIYKVSDPAVLHDETSAKIIAGVSYVQDGTKIQRVWATIEPPDFKPGSSDIPVTNLPEIELTDPDGDGVYEGVYNQFLLNGTYKITVCATNQKGMYALFRQTTVVRETAYIAALSSAQVVSQNSAKLWASVKPDIPVKKVWAEIQPPSVGSLPVELILSDPEKDGIYEAVFSNFSAEGTYAAKLYVSDTQGYTSPAIQTTVTYSTGVGKDEYEQDNTVLSAMAIRAGETQRHNFHAGDDTDWLKIFMLKGITYNIRTPNQELCQTSVDFYRNDKSAVLKDVLAALRVVAGLENASEIYADVNGDGRIGLEEALYGLREAAGLNTKAGIHPALLQSSDSAFDWTCPETGIYYLKIRNRTPDVFGQNVRYDVQVIKPSAGLSGKIRGTVKSSSGEPVSDAEIFTDGGGSDLSRDNGSFSLEDSIGKHVITVRADGYEEYRTAVTLTEAEQVLNIVLTKNR